MVWTHEPCASKQDFRLNPRMEEETSTSSTNLGTYVGEADGSPCAKLRDVSSLKFDPRARPRSECECSHWPRSECECSHSDRGRACGAQSRIQIPTAPRMTEAGRDRCTAFWNTFSVKCTTEEEEDTNPKKDVKEAVRAPSTKRALGTWRVWGCGGTRQLPLPRALFMF